MKQHELHAYFILFFLGKSGYQSQLWKCHCTCIVQLFYINAKCLLAYGFLFYRFVLYIFISYVFCHGNQCLHNNIVMYCMFCVVYSSYFIGMFNLVLCACVCGGGGISKIIICYCCCTFFNSNLNSIHVACRYVVWFTIGYLQFLYFV